MSATDLFVPRVPMGTKDAVMRRLFPRPYPYQDDPVGWVREVIRAYVWSKQREILSSVRDHRYTAVASAHQTGKSRVAGFAGAWWVDQHPESFILTTAPTAHQVSGILWREIRKIHKAGDLDGRINQASQPEWKIDGELVGVGKKPADKVDPEEAMQSIQGYHAPYFLALIDEACGVPEWLWTGIDSLVANDDVDGESAGRVLAIGNPDNPNSHFRRICMPGSGWNVIWISAFDTPAFTDEWNEIPRELRRALVGRTWVTERARRWGVKSPTYISKVLGRFPKVATDTLISPDLIEQAIRRDLSGEALGTPGRYGADIADQGNDETVIYLNRGGYIRLATMPDTLEECVWPVTTPMQVAGYLRVLLHSSIRHMDELAETSAVIDGIGVGAGVVSRLLELEEPVKSFNAAHRAYRHERFINRRAEQWWAVRTMFEEGLIDLDPEDEDLIAQLSAIKWGFRSNGKIYIEPKEDMVRRLGLDRSPDRADAFMHSTVQWDALAPYDERGDEIDTLIRRAKAKAGQGGDVEAEMADILDREL